ncbi:MAG: glycosyltransferase family 2 protein [Pseudomonadota bacterium]
MNETAQPIVSVIVPVYNSEQFLNRSIWSALDQRGLRLEVIAINDCSTDGSLSILEDFENRFAPRMRVLNMEKNVGQATARNAGINAAQGEYIAFLDSDDFYVDQRVLMRWVHASQEMNADMAYSRFIRVNEDEKELAAPPEATAKRKGLTTLSEAPELVNGQACWQFLYRKAFLDRHDLRFSENLKQREDRLFFTQALMLSERISILKLRSIAYRNHSASTMRRIEWGQLDMFAQHVEELNHFTEEHLPPVDAQGGLPGFRFANAMAYLRSISQYWRPILLKPRVHERREFRRLVDGLSELIGPFRDFKKESSLLLNPNLERLQASGYFDLLAFLIRERDYVGVQECIASQCVHVEGFEDRMAKTNKPDECLALMTDRLAFASSMSRRNSKSNLPVLLREFDARAGQAGTRFELHLGMTKTGSSAIQWALERLRYDLAKRRDWYPVAGVERGSIHRLHRSSGHAKLVNALLQGEPGPLTLFLRELLDFKTFPRRIILSAENVLSERYWNGGDVLTALKSLVTDKPVRVHAYLRRQDEWLESMYNELLCNPGNNTFTDTPAGFVSDVIDSGYLNYDWLEGQIVEAFPGAEVALHSFEHMRDTTDAVAHFLGLLGIEELQSRLAGEEINPSSDKFIGRILLEANRRGMTKPAKWELEARLLSMGIKAPRTMAHIDTALRDDIMSSYRSSNEVFARRHPEFAALLNPVKDGQEAILADHVAEHFAIIEQTSSDVEADDSSSRAAAEAW